MLHGPASRRQRGVLVQATRASVVLAMGLGTFAVAIASAPAALADTTATFTSSDSCQPYVVPANVNQIDVTVVGGAGFAGSGPGSPGGRGGQVTARFNVESGETLYAVVGGPGGGTGHENRGGGGRHSGGAGGDGLYGVSWDDTAYGGGGGGASFLSSDDTQCVTPGSDINPNAVFAVAGGGGGGGSEDSVGDDGGAGGDAGHPGGSAQACIPIFGCSSGGQGGGAGTSSGGGGPGYNDGGEGGGNWLGNAPSGGGSSYLYSDGGSALADGSFGGAGGGGWFGGGQGGDQADSYAGGGGGSNYVQSGVVAAGSTPTLGVDTTGTAPEISITPAPTRRLKVSISSAGTGTGSVTSSDSTINCGTTCTTYYATGATTTLTANVPTGQRFVGWTGGTCSGTVTTCTVTMDQARTVTATFNQLRRVTLTSEDTWPFGNGTITASPAGYPCGTGCIDFDTGTTVTLTAHPDASSVFMGWQDGIPSGCDDSSLTCTFTLTDRDRTEYYDFEQNVLSIQKVGAGSGTVTGSVNGVPCATDCSGLYPYGTTVTLTATADPGSTAQWQTYPCYDGTNNATCSYTMDGSQTLRVSFTKNPEWLSVDTAGGNGGVASSDGSINCSSDTGSCSGMMRSYDQFTTVTLTATPETGTPYNNTTFSGWSGACSNTTGPCVVTMNQAESVVAHFTPIPQYVLTVSPAGGGSGTVTSADGDINCGSSCIESYYYTGTQVTLTETPGSTSTFTGWTGGCTGAGTTCTVSMSAAQSVTATFALTTRHLTVATTGSGGGTVTGEFYSVGINAEDVTINCGATCTGDYDYGDQISLVANPASNAIFTGWSGDCTGTDDVCRVTMDQARSVTATFTRNTRVLTVSTTGAGAGTVSSDVSGTDGQPISCGPGATSCSDTFDYGTTVTLTATPRLADSRFTGWSGACVTASNQCVTSMYGAESATANFELNTLTVATAGGGSGTVTSGDSSISCGSTCFGAYPTGTLVTLTATPSANSTFTGWSAPCQNDFTGACIISVSSAASVTATFTTTPSIHVVLSGTGAANGEVFDGSGAINCGQSFTNCSSAFAPGQSVTLNAQAANGSSTTFDGWSGACTGTGPSCTFTPTDAVTVTALFTYHSNPLTVTTTGTGGGSVASSPTGFSCGGNSVCSASYGVNSSVSLLATPDANSTFAGWSGACSGTGSCTVPDLSVARFVTATFTAKPAFTLTVAMSGTGRDTITTDTGGINCGTTCSATYQSGTLVWITATVGAHTAFNNFGATGCIAVKGPNNDQCEIQVNNAMTVTASATLSTQFIYASGYYMETGGGTVTSDVSGINCSAAATAPGCGASFEQGAVVTLTATPDASSTFTSWGNVTCQNSDSGTTGICQVLNTSGANVSVTFTHNPITVSYKADAGAGTGKIETATAQGAAYNCSFHCTLTYAYHYGPGYNIQAYAQPDPNMKFVRWNGPGCSTSQYCLINPWDQNLTYTAEFEPITQTLSVQMRTNDSGTGSGSFLVSSLVGTTTCTTSCTVTVDQGDTVSVTALNGATGTFNRWVSSSGTCGANATCSIPIGSGTANAAVYFDGVPQSLSVNTAGVGSGSVTSSIGGINCGTNCSLTLPYGYTVTLHALPSAGSVFTGWSGDVGSCATSPSCVVPFTQSRNVTATFALAPETLTVTTDGNGVGSVSSDVGGIDCGSSCTAPIAANDDVTLTAVPDATSSTFTGWSGDTGACSNSSPTCVVTMDQARTIDANFTLIPRHLTLTTDGTGTGTISSDPSGIDCGTTCSSDFDHGTSVTLTATPDAGSGFAGWTGDCSGTDPCTVTLDAAKSVGATFTLLPLHSLTVTTAGNGSGTVSSDDATITCGPGSSACSHDYPSDAVVTLHAVPTDAKSIFTGWSGGCAGSDDSCQIGLDQARTVTATFALVTVPSTTVLTLSTASRAYDAASTAKVTVTGGSTPATGKVSLLDGKTVVGTGNLTAGSVTIAVPKTLAVGIHKLSAAYAGATPMMASTSTTKQLTVVKAVSTVTGKLAKSSVTTKAKAKVAVTVTTSAGVASGTVSIKHGSKVIAHGTLKNGKLTIKLAPLKAGKYKLTVVYGGSATAASGTSKVITLTVKKT